MNRGKDADRAQHFRRSPLAIIGVLPPPYGGVSTHLKGLLPYLDASDVDYAFYNIGPAIVSRPRVMNVGKSLGWMARQFLRPHRFYHIHTSKWWARVLFSCLVRTRGGHLIVTAHGASLLKSISSKNPLKRILSRWATKSVLLVIATNEYIKTGLADHGFCADRIRVIPAFVPPSPSREDEIPEEVLRFCENRGPILMATASYTLIDGKDVYGLRAMVDLVRQLRGEHPTIGLVVFVARKKNARRDAFQDVLSEISHPPLCDHVLFHDSCSEFYPALRRCDLFLRPTTTDGDANSVREALWFDVPVIASDVIPRPSGCRTYRAGSQDDFCGEVQKVLSEPQDETVRCDQTRVNPANQIVALYKEVLDVTPGQSCRSDAPGRL